MRPTWATALCCWLLPILIGGTGCPTRHESHGGDELRHAPRLTGKNLEDEYLALRDYRGKVVLLNIWASWCGPCRKELPALQALHARHQRGNDAFTVLGVSVDAVKDHRKVASMIERYGLSYPVMLDPLGKSVEAFSVRGYPTSFLIGPDGTVLWRRDGIIKAEDLDLDNQIEAALRLPRPPSE